MLRRLTSFHSMLKEQNCGSPKSKHNGYNTCLRFSVDASLTSRFASIDVISFIKSNIFFCKSVFFFLHHWNAKPTRLIPIPVYTLKTLLCFGDVEFWNGSTPCKVIFRRPKSNAFTLVLAVCQRQRNKSVNLDQSRQNALGQTRLQTNTPWRTKRGKMGDRHLPLGSVLPLSG